MTSGRGEYDLLYVRDKGGRTEVDFLGAKDGNPWALFECKSGDATLAGNNTTPFSTHRISIPPCVIFMYFAPSKAVKRRISRTVESNGRTGRNGRLFGCRIAVREGGESRFAGQGRGCVNYWKFVGNAFLGSEPLDTRGGPSVCSAPLTATSGTNPAPPPPAKAPAQPPRKKKFQKP